MTVTGGDLPELLGAAVERRHELRARLHAEGTDCYRLFHGVVEGQGGLTVDRYGELILAQTFREALDDPSWATLQAALADLVPEAPLRVLNHRSGGEQQPASDEALQPVWAREQGLAYRIVARHRGRDPWLFLDLRSARRWVRSSSAGLRVLNLFAYTCGVGVAAAAGGAARVCNVDFSASHLAVGWENAERNGRQQQFLQDDVLLVVRQLAGLPVKGRAARRRYVRRDPESFDLVVLDPPRWARSRWGAVDVVRDYPSIFKPAVLATVPGGRVLATNHVSSVPLEEWIDALERCAAKAGRPQRGVEVLQPDEDFPTFDGRPPLKVAVCQT